ncbi:hypothetical protein F4779DRAFT_565935 [Xylariaceae sp. FL0662B]|nr:hypothetical protein F4779DRAFT_565935 [Xylariaceae sp. FL0662B]
MSPPLPVPSKAAIHALRGIALGTSCALGVILEDRRRRINTLRTIIANKEKLRSARQYHGALDLFASQFEGQDQAVLVGIDIQWKPMQIDVQDERERPTVFSTPRKGRDPLRELQEPGTVPGPDAESESSSHPVTRTQSSPPPPTQRAVPHRESSWGRPTSIRTNTTIPKISTQASLQAAQTSAPELSAKKRAALIKDINTILASNDEEKLDRAIDKFLSATQTYYSSRPFDDEWLEVSSRLSKESQADGRWEDASKILITAINAGPLDESQFHAHEPLRIVRFYLGPEDAKIPCSRKALAAASALFLTTFKEKPRLYTAELERVGRRLVTKSLLFGDMATVNGVFWRLLPLMEDPAPFTGWFMQMLDEAKAYKSVVKCFLLNFSKMKPNEACYNKALDCVVHSVEELRGLKANAMIRAFARMDCPGKGLLRTRWIMRILQAEWHRDEDFSRLTALFEEVMSLDLLSKVTHPEGIYRTMVEISIKANEEAVAQSYYRKLIQDYPHMIMDVPLRGFLALARAKAGDWDGVLDAFTEMYRHRHGQEKVYDDAFVMVLKVFADNHPVAEVRDFVAKYMKDLGVRMHHYIATLVANKYGDCHDMLGLVSWLELCSKTGFGLDTGCCNTVLHHCRTQWGLSFPELQKLYLKMKRFKPEFPDRVTRRIMSQATLAAKKRAGTSRKGLGVRSKIISVGRRAYAGETANQRDVYEAMNQELSNGRTASTVTIYKRAMSFGMPFSSHCLRLAVAAALKGSNGPGSAMMLIHNAHQQGHDVSSSVSTYIRFQLDNFRASPQEIMLHMRNLVSRFEALHIIIDSEALTHMANVCIKVGKHDKAITLCQVAMNRSGSSNLCFSRQSFRTLLMAYSQTLDPEGLRELIGHLLASQYSADKAVLSYLRSTKRTVQRYKRQPTVVALQDILERAINAVAQSRTENRMEGKTISQETLRIMGDAVANMQDSKSVGSLLQSHDDDEEPHRSTRLPRIVAVGV